MNHLWKFFICAILYFLCSDIFSKTNFSIPSNTQNKKVPPILTVGIIPVHGLDNFTNQQAKVQSWFSKAVRNSKRFRVINDELTSSLWEKKEGREELIKEFEVDSFMTLRFVENEDQVVIKVYLLDKNLDAILTESDVFLTGKFASTSEALTEEIIESLVFRVINRLPTDVIVTSIQGPFVTLSGGTDQSLQLGDQLTIVRARIKSLHPANNTWLDFQRSLQGTAKVVEVKNQSSIAQITQQLFDGAIEVGDGAKLPNIPGRQKFALTQKDRVLKDAPPQDPIIVPPLVVDDSKPQSSPAKVVKTPPQQSVEPNPASIKQEQDGSSESSDDKPTQTSPTPPAVNEDHEEESVWDSFSTEATSHKVFETATLNVGPTWWSVKGPTNSSGRFPIYLVNNVGVQLARTMFYNFKLSLGGGGIFGQTPDSNYIGYESMLRFYWEDYLAGDFISHWHAGGTSTFSGVNVSQGGYGGGDWLRGGLFAGLGGFTNAGLDPLRFDWFGNFSLFPLNLGRLGYNGSFKQVESSMGWSIDLGAFMWAPPGELQYGGMIAFSDERETLKNGRRPHLENFSIKALFRLKL